MVAVAAGDPQEAARYAAKADKLLDEPPLTMLLSAQAAQLNGDEAAAKRYFEAMLKEPETRFLGLRGLIMQAMREGNDRAALDYARQAKALRPKTPWLLTTLLELNERRGDLAAAESVLQEAVKAKALPKPEAMRKQAELLRERAARAADGEQALALARRAHKLQPENMATLRTLAQAAIARGRPREAGHALEKAWHLAPEPDIARLYLALRPEDAPLDQVKRLGKLTGRQPDHPESHLALAEACLKARLWGEARRHLQAVLPSDEPQPVPLPSRGGIEVPPLEELEAAGARAAVEAASLDDQAARVAALRRSRACRLMAQLEEAENRDTEAARRWLARAMTIYDSVAAPRPLFIEEGLEARALPPRRTPPAERGQMERRAPTEAPKTVAQPPAVPGSDGARGVAAAGATTVVPVASDPSAPEGGGRETDAEAERRRRQGAEPDKPNSAVAG